MFLSREIDIKLCQNTIYDIYLVYIYYIQFAPIIIFFLNFHFPVLINTNDNNITYSPYSPY